VLLAFSPINTGAFSYLNHSNWYTAFFVAAMLAVPISNQVMAFFMMNSCVIEVALVMLGCC
jgi:hypothetical protein